MTLKVPSPLNFLLCVILLGGCASKRKETLYSMGGTFAGGAVIGAAQAPEGDNRLMHGLLWGALASVITGAIIVYFTDEDKRVAQRDEEIRDLQQKLQTGKALLEKGQSQFFEKELPAELQGLVQPGEWSLFEVDEWRQTKPGEFVHYDQILEVKPAKLKRKLN